LQSKIVLSQRSNYEVIGEYKAVCTLASAIHTQLDFEPGKEEASDVTVLTEKQLRCRITKDLKGGSMIIGPSLPLDGKSEINSDQRLLPSFGALLKKEMWWLLVMLGAFVAVLTGFAITQQWLLTLFMPIELAFVLYVGTNGRSRAVLTAYLLCVFCARTMLPFFIGLLSSTLKD
jgi:hypothetical protein